MGAIRYFLSAGHCWGTGECNIELDMESISSNQCFTVSQKAQVHIHLEEYQGVAAIAVLDVSMPSDTEGSPEEMWHPVRPLRQGCPEGRKRSRIWPIGHAAVLEIQ